MRYHKPWSCLGLILIVLSGSGVEAGMVCSKNRADCLELPLEWDRHKEEKALVASRYVDGDRLTLHVIESSPDYWEQTIQDFLDPLKRKGGLREYDVEEITAGGINYTGYSYEAFGRRFKSGTSRRMDFYVYRRGPMVRIVQFETSGGAFMKMGYEIEEILGSAVFFDPKSMEEEKKKDSKKEDDGWGEYGYKPAEGLDGGDNYGWGDDLEKSDDQVKQENQSDETISEHEEPRGLTGDVSDLDSIQSLISPESELKKKWISLEKGYSYSELEKRRLSFEEESSEREKKRDWLHDDTSPFENSEETDNDW